MVYSPKLASTDHFNYRNSYSYVGVTLKYQDTVVPSIINIIARDS